MVHNANCCISYSNHISGVYQMQPSAYAVISGNYDNPNLHGNAYFYENNSHGVWIEVEINGLPHTSSKNYTGFFGMHIHENGNCTRPFDQTGEHYNPSQLPHPEHAGDLPPLLGNNGYAFSLVYTNRFTLDDILGRSLIIHSDADDFTSQPSGNAGTKIGCGIIRAYFSSF